MRRCCAFLALSLGAAAVASGAPPVALEPVVVTATRSERPAFETPASIDRVDAEDIGASKLGVNLSEVLGAVPGVLVRDRQNYAQDQQISIRGFGTRAPFGIVGARLLVDGLPATMPDGQGQVSHFNLDSAGRIEVLRGPFSSLYGNAAGGVIQIFTEEGTPTPQFGAETVAGAYGNSRSSLNARGTGGPLNYNADYTHFETGGSREHSGARRDSGNARLALDWGGGTRLRLLANTVSVPLAQDPLGLTRAQFASNPRQATASALLFNTRKSVEQTQAGLVAEQAIGESQSLQLTGYYGRRAIEQFLAIPVGAQSNALHSGGVVDLHNSYAGADLRWTLRGALLERPLNFAAGLNYDLQNSQRRGYENFSGSTLGVRGNLRRDEDNRMYDFDQYLQAGWDFAEHWLALAGLRHNAVRFRSQDHYLTASNPDDSGALDFGAATPVAGLLYRASEHLHWYGSYGEGFDTPTANELAYRSDGSSGLNRALRPARTRSAELGAKWRPAENLVINAAVFHALTRDEIVVATAQGGRQTYQNAGHARRRGIELESSASLGAAWRWQFAWTLIAAEFREPYLTCASRICATPDTTIAAGSRVPGVAKSNLFSALRWGAEAGWSAALEGSYLSAAPVNSSNSEFAPAYTVIGINAGYGWSLAPWQAKFFLRLDNALDRAYAGSAIINDVNGQYYEPAPERSLFAGLELRWKP